MAEKESFQMTLPASEIDAALLAAKTAVSYEPQTVPPEKQAQARANIGAVTVDEVKDSLLNFEVSGEFVEFEPKPGSELKVVSHYEQATRSSRTFLYHVNGRNLIDVAGMLGGAGTVFEKDGLTATINADSTITITGTNTSSGWTTIANAEFGTAENAVYLPPGTYTVPPNVNFAAYTKGHGNDWNEVSLGNKTKTFTVDEWIRVSSFNIPFASGAIVNTTIPLVVVRGATLPTSDFEYSGNSYCIEYISTDPGVLDFSTGKVYDMDGNHVENVSVPAITALPGTNYMWTVGGPVDVSGSSNFAGGGGSSSAEAFDPEVWGLPVLKLSGNTGAMSKDNAVTLDYTYGTQKGTCTCKWQGSSSLSYVKKNYTIKFDNAFEAVEGWGTQNRYCFKANYIDHSHARNLVNAKLWGEVVKSRSNVPAELTGLPNYGAVDGFPVVIMLNDEFHGLYTFNIPKDSWMFGMGAGTQEAILCAGNACPANGFKEEATLVGENDLEIEYITDEDNTTWAVTSVNNLISACINSTGSDLDTTIANMLDWQSAIDYYIFTVLLEGQDMTLKNYLLVTFNGTKWYFSAYDMDSTHGLHWNGQSFLSANVSPTFESFANQHRVMELIKTYKKDALKARYAQLRETVLSESNLATLVNNFTGKIPSPVYMQDVKKWPMIPNSSANNASQIRDYYRMRVAYADKWMESL